MTDSNTEARHLGAVRTQTLVALEEVNKSFGDLHVLRNINLALDRGEVLVIVGPSGGGKSTLCRTVNRLEPIDSGRILFDGQPLPVEGRELARHRADVGMVFQSFNLFAHKTVIQNITLGPVNVRKTAKAQAEAQAMDLLKRVGIQSQAH
jgi:glutamate transport system ATP-binding protein